MKNKSLLSVLVAGGILMAGCGNTEDTKKEDKPETEQTDKGTPEGDLSSELLAYEQFALEQIDQFLLETEEFANLVKDGGFE